MLLTLTTTHNRAQSSGLDRAGIYYGLAEIDDPSQKIKLSYAKAKQFFVSPAKGVGGFKQTCQPDAFNRALVRESNLGFVLKEAATDVVLL